jgi:hypothetical protein
MQIQELIVGNWVRHKLNWSYRNDIGTFNEFDFQGVEVQQERMYSEEDMVAFLDWSKSTNKEKSEYELRCLLHGKEIDSKELFTIWFEQFKK